MTDQRKRDRDAPQFLYADRGPRGGWMFRDTRMPDTQHVYQRIDTPPAPTDNTALVEAMNAGFKAACDFDIAHPLVKELQAKAALSSRAAAPTSPTDNAVLAEQLSYIARCLPDNVSKDTCEKINRASEILCALRAESPLGEAVPVSVADIVKDATVVAEHNGCGHGIQCDQIWIRLNRGDKVLQLTAAQLAAPVERFSL